MSSWIGNNNACSNSLFNGNSDFIWTKKRTSHPVTGEDNLSNAPEIMIENESHDVIHNYHWCEFDTVPITPCQWFCA